jgi:predicted alpha/beta hydrolase
MAVQKREFTIRADDGYRLAAQLYEPATGAPAGAPLTIIGSATGVPQSYYGRFATYLAEHGRIVLTFDGRGIAKSAPPSLIGFEARFRDWGILDFPGVIDWAETSQPGRPLHWVGHSYGGFGLGLARNNSAVSKLLGISTMTADARMVESKLGAAQVGLMLFVLGPLAARTRGYVKGQYFGGTDLPRDVVLEWSQWCRTKGFLFGVEDLPQKQYFETLNANVRLTLPLDDPWLGKRGVEHLLSQFPNAKSRDIWTFGPADGGGKPIGHLGFFRSDFHETLWPKAREWLESGARL